ncbi:MAG: uroporphyrinogen decarboxylase family protein [Planctomycetota bacterium]
MTCDLSALHRDVVFGRSGGRIIWQPRIGCWLTDKRFAGEELPPRYRGMDLPAIYRDLGCSARVYDFNACFKRVEHPGVRSTWRELSDTDRELVIETPAGRQTAVQRRTDSNPYGIGLKREVETEDELKVAAWREENATWEWDQARYGELLGVWRGLGAPTMFMPRMNVQSLYIDKMGVERGVFAIYDWPDTVEAYFRALEECHDRLIDVVNASPVEIVNFGENVHAGTLSPELFRKYHLPACVRRAERLHAGGKFVHAHWDGDVGPLLPFARETGLDGIEAITPRPQGDVTLEEVKEALGDMVLPDGIPAVYFDETYPVTVLEDCARRAIELFAPRLVLGISDEISSTGDMERVRVVGRIVDEYNAQFN